MERGRLNKYTLLALVLIISAVFLVMIKNFLMPLFMAGLFSAMVLPAHGWLVPKVGGRKNLASAMIVAGVVVLIMLPLSILVGIILSQAVRVGQSVAPLVQRLMSEPVLFETYLKKVPYYEQIIPYKDQIIQKMGNLVGAVSNFLIDSLQAVGSTTIDAVFGIIIMLYVMFYFMSMGKELLKKILYFLPLGDEDEQRLLIRFTSVTRATIKGSMIIGLMQGSICGAAFSLAGIDGAVFWGSVMAFSSVIPAFGTAVIWGPAALILLIIGNYKGMFILIFICGVISGNLDNLVRPRLVGKDTEMHDLFVLFGTLGGISMFGLPGIIIGPIIAALFITIWEIYGDTFKDYLPEVRMFEQSVPLEVPPGLEPKEESKPGEI
ncbi:MAG: AI-2E family transporter [Deltaproteobacteria bacterium]|nr:MAG: AI-2E family transporter [Deltaproteobacteria bacterium]